MAHNLRTFEHLRAAHCHIALCQLTEILGELLPLVFGMASTPRETSNTIRQINSNLDVWEDSLPDWLRDPIAHSGLRIAGSCSLRLSFLAVKMLVRRVELKVSLALSFSLLFLFFILYKPSCLQVVPRLLATKETTQIPISSTRSVENRRRIL